MLKNGTNNQNVNKQKDKNITKHQDEQLERQNRHNIRTTNQNVEKQSENSLTSTTMRGAPTVLQQFQILSPS